MSCKSATVILATLSAAVLTAGHILADAEVVVYSPKSDQPLHVSSGGVTTSFPASYTGHRSVCVISGATTNDTFAAWTGQSDAYELGDPFGVSSGRDYPAIGLTRTTAIMPRINVFANESDRMKVIGEAVATTTNGPAVFARFTDLPTLDSVRVRVLRARVDNFTPFNAGVRDERVIVDSVMTRGESEILHEGLLLSEDRPDIDWDLLYEDVVTSRGVIMAGGVVTNVNYLIVFGDGAVDYNNVATTNTQVHAHPILIDRRFERTRTRPTAKGSKTHGDSVELYWQIVGEDPWASRYGTTYTAYKVNAWLGGNTNAAPWHTTGVKRMPPADSRGVYRHVIDGVPNGSTLTWQVFTYNSKFKEDKNGGSEPQTVTVSY